MFRAIWWKRFEEFATVVMFGIVTFLLIFYGQRDALVHIWGFFAVIAVVAIFALFYCLFSVSEVTIQPNQLVYRAMFNRKVIHRDQIKNIQLSVAGSSSVVIINLSPKGRVTIRFKSFAPSLLPAMMRWKEARPIPAELPTSAGEHRMPGLATATLAFGILLGGGVIAIGATKGSTYDTIPSLILGILLCGVFVYLGLLALRSHVRLTQDSITVQHMGKQNTVRWEDITSINLTTFRTKSEVRETIEVHTTDGITHIWSSFEDFPLIRDAILARVDPAKVTDSRAMR